MKINPLMVIILGLLLAQAIGAIQVYNSNINLKQKMEAVSQEGYMPVPNQSVVSGLDGFWPAFGGGLFFTLTVGAGLTVLTLLVSWLWVWLGKRPLLLIPITAAWVILLFLANRPHISFWASLYFLLLPPIVFSAGVFALSNRKENHKWLKRLCFVLPIILLAAAWRTQYNDLMFVNIRDQLLLTNPLGQKINTAYYNYTLYPAEAFKSFRQKQIKTVDISGLEKSRTKNKIARTLIYRDWLPVKSPPYDLVLKKDGKTLIFENKNKQILRMPVSKFFSFPSKSLNSFSQKTDTHTFLRKSVLIGLMAGLPLILYIPVFIILKGLIGLIASPRKSIVITAALCLAAGLALFIPVYLNDVQAPETGDLDKALNSRHWGNRAAALRVIRDKKLEIANYQGYKNMLVSSRVPDRYWLARAMGVSKKKETYKALLFLLKDPDINVVTMACLGLSSRKNRGAVTELRKLMAASNHWYVQMYAYRALRRLNWRQHK